MTNAASSSATAPTTASSRPRYGRAVNITLRTAHIGVTGVLCGGHVFDIPPESLRIWLVWTIVTGGLLAVVEAYPHVYWLYQGRGLFVLTKLALLCLIPWLWPYRVAILVAVIILAGIGSHMPARFRYYSVLHGRML
jgi:phage shock protein PspC (stress-responsive transcriptional regulator)